MLDGIPTQVGIFPKNNKIIAPELFGGPELRVLRFIFQQMILEVFSSSSKLRVQQYLSVLMVVFFITIGLSAFFGKKKHPKKSINLILLSPKWKVLRNPKTSLNPEFSHTYSLANQVDFDEKVTTNKQTKHLETIRIGQNMCEKSNSQFQNWLLDLVSKTYEL